MYFSLLPVQKGNRWNENFYNYWLLTYFILKKKITVASILFCISIASESLRAAELKSTVKFKKLYEKKKLEKDRLYIKIFLNNNFTYEY